LIVDSLEIIERHIGPTNLEAVEVNFKREDRAHGMPSLVGLAASNTHQTKIFVEYGLPYSYALGVLCHEFGHALLFRDQTTLIQRRSAGTHDPQTEEGFCEDLFAVALQTQSSPVAKWQAFLKPADPSPVYGDGFRMMWKRATELGTVAALLEEVSGDKIGFDGPRVGTVVDDGGFDEFVPLVDGGSADPTKGPLRGTALKPTELPADSPKGPRLRGTALAGTPVADAAAAAPPRRGLQGTGLRLPSEKGNPKDPRTKDPTSSSSRLRGKGIK